MTMRAAFPTAWGSRGAVSRLPPSREAKLGSPPLSTPADSGRAGAASARFTPAAVAAAAIGTAALPSSRCRRRGAGFIRHAGSKARSEVAREPSGAGLESWAKWRTFWACFCGYAICYFTRQSLNYTAPYLRAAMGWHGLAQLGQLSSIFPLAYGSSRFLGGVLGDLMSPKKVFALGLGVCGVLNVAFGLSSSLPAFALFWFLNGCFQGLMAPACVKMITNWFAKEERGTWWSVWHASINLGGFMIPFLSGGLAEALGWRFGMIGPGAIATGFALLCLLLMKDKPSGHTGAQQVAADSSEPSTDGSGSEKQAEKDSGQDVSLLQGIFMDPAQWALGAAYLVNYVVRQGLAVWGVFYLREVSGAASAARAAALFSGFELGGFLGNLTAGALSDVLLRRAEPGDGLPGQRAKVVNIYFAAMLILLPLFSRSPSSMPALQYLLLLALGHFICGAQLLLPLVAAERAPQRWLSTATGFIGWVGYFGAALAGLPLSFVVQQLGWGVYFAVLMVAAAVGTALMVPLCSLRSWKQLPASAKAA